MSQLEAYAESVKRTATFIGRSLPPDGDWTPILIYETGNGKTEMIEAPSLGGDDRHEKMRELAQHIRNQNAVAVVFVHMIWHVGGLSEDDVQAIIDGDAPRASERPDRREALSVLGFDNEGGQVASVSFVERREGKPPLLGAWDDGPTLSLSGDMVDPLKWAVGASS